MAGHATGIVYADMTLTRSKVKVKVAGLLNFQKLPKPCMLVAMTVSPLRAFWFKLLLHSIISANEVAFASSVSMVVCSSADLTSLSEPSFKFRSNLVCW